MKYSEPSTLVSRPVWFWRGFWMISAAAIVALIVISLLRPVRPKELSEAARLDASHSSDPSIEFVKVVGPRRIWIKPGTPLAHSLDILAVSKETVSYPLLTVTGSVVARVGPGNGPLELRWQFASADISGAFTDWLKTSADIQFNEQRVETIRELTKAQVTRHESIVAHLKPLAPEGGVAGKDLRAAEADLVQSKLQGQKDVFEAETALRASQREKTALERQLAQAGIEPVVLSRARDKMVLISANVPEAKISLVTQGQACEARFFGFPDVVFSAHVEELGSVLSTERRTLRVLFDLDDNEGHLKPGMFAEVGLGTSEREAVLIPASAVLHIGRADYVFKQAGEEGQFEVAEVRISESRGEEVEVLSGLRPGDRVAGNEAVLLKPLAVRSLTP